MDRHLTFQIPSFFPIIIDKIDEDFVYNNDKDNRKIEW